MWSSLNSRIVDPMAPAARCGEPVETSNVDGVRRRLVLGLALPVDGKVYHVDFDDWMFLINDRVMLNRSFMSKWGFPLGEVTLSFVKQ